MSSDYHLLAISLYVQANIECHEFEQGNFGRFDFNWSYRPESLKSGWNGINLACLTLRLEWWPWWTIREPPSSVHHAVTICENKLEVIVWTRWKQGQIGEFVACVILKFNVWHYKATGQPLRWSNFRSMFLNESSCVSLTYWRGIFYWRLAVIIVLEHCLLPWWFGPYAFTLK